MRFGVIVYPGTWSDGDCYHAVRDALGQEAQYVWHKDTQVSNFHCLILPGGFSYGDYLRAGAIARFSPVMGAVEEFAARGGLVIGICNGFQILCEAGLLPGALMRNRHLQFRCERVSVRVENLHTPYTSACRQDQVLHLPISHGDGSYYIEEVPLAQLEERGQVLFRYATPEGKITDEANPNGSLNNIAGVINDQGTVLGMMPHPERACEELLGGTDGRLIFGSIIQSLREVAG